jgi:2-polyprenyl-3-methyl-5-hydroxy-6-metoxy-1,4-benzoquinol methylase
MDRYALTFDTWNQLASAYQDKFMELDLYNDTYDLFCNAISSLQARVLEIGCGPGNITRYLLAQRPGFSITGIDVAPNMVTLARANNPTAQFMVMDCRELHALAPGFDAIICGFCMPYCSQQDCAKLVNDCAALLSTGGIWYGSVIEGRYEESEYQTSSTGHTSYVYYHEADWLIDTLQAAGFTLLHTLRKAYPGSQRPHLILIAQKSNR